ncbi:MAG: hypothetical protein QOD26_322 [Betaproteobacteria bacterium]|jgi:hypothetical protein|nr:hypothetical protein [Betaproteobacteria bacterium]
MRKFIPFLFCGFAALSYSAIAADTSVDAEAQTKAQSGAPVGATGAANAGADVRGDANPGAGTAADNAVSEKKGNEVHGASPDSHQANPKAGKQAKRKQKDESGAGATTGERRY